MKSTVCELETDILVFTGDGLGSNATIFIDGSKALLVDALATKADGLELKSFLEERGLSVSGFLISHYFSDHLAALSLFPEARIIAHSGYLNTFFQEDYRTPEEASFFVSPDSLIGDRLDIQWGRHALNIFHAPGHTASTLCIDVPTADLLLSSDNAVGSIAYFYYSHPLAIQKQLQALAALSRNHLIQGHGGISAYQKLLDSLHYVDNVVRESTAKGITELGPIADYLAPGLAPTDFENFFHERNRRTVASRQPFSYLNGGIPLV